MEHKPYEPEYDWQDEKTVFTGKPGENPFVKDLSDEDFFKVVHAATKTRNKTSKPLAAEKADQLLNALTDNSVFAKEYFDRQVYKISGTLFKLSSNPDIIPLAREAASLYRKQNLYGLMLMFTKAAGRQDILPKTFTGRLNVDDELRLSRIQSVFVDYRLKGRVFYDGKEYTDPQLALMEETPFFIDPKQDEVIESLASDAALHRFAEETFQTFKTYKIFKQEKVLYSALKELSYYLSCASTRSWPELETEEKLTKEADRIGWTYFSEMEEKFEAPVPSEIAEKAKELSFRESVFHIVTDNLPHPCRFEEEVSPNSDQHKMYVFTRSYFLNKVESLRKESQSLAEPYLKAWEAEGVRLKEEAEAKKLAEIAAIQPGLREGHLELKDPIRILKETAKAYLLETTDWERSFIDEDGKLDWSYHTWKPKSILSVQDGYVIGMPLWLARQLRVCPVGYEPSRSRNPHIPFRKSTPKERKEWEAYKKEREEAKKAEAEAAAKAEAETSEKAQES
jgi:hypothetical protein